MIHISRSLMQSPKLGAVASAIVAIVNIVVGRLYEKGIFEAPEDMARLIDTASETLQRLTNMRKNVLDQIASNITTTLVQQGYDGINISNTMQNRHDQTSPLTTSEIHTSTSIMVWTPPTKPETWKLINFGDLLKWFTTAHNHLTQGVSDERGKMLPKPRNIITNSILVYQKRSLVIEIPKDVSLKDIICLLLVITLMIYALMVLIMNGGATKKVQALTRKVLNSLGLQRSQDIATIEDTLNHTTSALPWHIRDSINNNSRSNAHSNTRSNTSNSNSMRSHNGRISHSRLPSSTESSFINNQKRNNIIHSNNREKINNKTLSKVEKIQNVIHSLMDGNIRKTIKQSKLEDTSGYLAELMFSKDHKAVHDIIVRSVSSVRQSDINDFLQSLGGLFAHGLRMRIQTIGEINQGDLDHLKITLVEAMLKLNRVQGDIVLREMSRLPNMHIFINNVRKEVDNERVLNEVLLTYRKEIKALQIFFNITNDRLIELKQSILLCQRYFLSTFNPSNATFDYVKGALTKVEEHLLHANKKPNDDIDLKVLYFACLVGYSSLSDAASRQKLLDWLVRFGMNDIFTIINLYVEQLSQNERGSHSVILGKRHEDNRSTDTNGYALDLLMSSILTTNNMTNTANLSYDVKNMVAYMLSPLNTTSLNNVPRVIHRLMFSSFSEKVKAILEIIRKSTEYNEYERQHIGSVLAASLNVICKTAPNTLRKQILNIPYLSKTLHSKLQCYSRPN